MAAAAEVRECSAEESDRPGRSVSLPPAPGGRISADTGPAPGSISRRIFTTRSGASSAATRSPPESAAVLRR